MVQHSPATSQRSFRAKVTEHHTITLPTDLRRQLRIEPGDSVELALTDQEATLRRVADAPVQTAGGAPHDEFADWEGPHHLNRQPPQTGSDEVATTPSPRARGILRDAFTGWDDIQHFIAEERRAWEDEEDSSEPAPAHTSSG